MTGVLIVCAVTVGALAIAGWVVNVAQSAPNLSTLKPYVPGSPSQVFAADGTSLGYIWSPTVHTEIAGSRIPERLKEATIAIEDRRFYQHGALDYQGIVRAAIKDAVKGGDGLQGASTLTMQLVDNTYLPRRFKSNHDLKYKIVQAKLAEQLESQHSKDWILDNYLNDVPYGTVGGQTAYGVAAASQMFFDKPVQKLSLAQDGAAGRPAAGAVRIQPVHPQRRRAAPALGGAAGDGDGRLHHPGRTPTRPPPSAWGSRPTTPCRSTRTPTCSTTSRSRRRATCAPRRPTTARRCSRAG